jgi:PRC-barrel domain
MATTSTPERRTYDSPRTDEPRTAYMQRAVAEPTRKAQGLSWPYWVLPLLALAGLFWYMLPRDREVAERQATEPVRTSQPATPSNRVAVSPESRSIFLARAPDNWVSIGNRPNDYIGQVIHDRNGQELGSIKDVLIGPDGAPAAVLLNVGRFLGIGDDKNVAVQMSALKLDQQGNTRRIVVDVTKRLCRRRPLSTRQSNDGTISQRAGDRTQLPFAGQSDAGFLMGHVALMLVVALVYAQS